MDAGLLQQTFICPEPRFLDYPLFTREPNDNWSQLAWVAMQVQTKFLRIFREVTTGQPGLEARDVSAKRSIAHIRFSDDQHAIVR